MRCTRLLTGTLMAAVSFTTALSAYGQVSKEVMDIALYGPEGKNLAIKELGRDKQHKFNVKMINYSSDDDGVVVTGQLSHHLRLSDDDQLYFVITKAHGEPATRSVRIKGSKVGNILRGAGKVSKWPLPDVPFKEVLEAVQEAAKVAGELGQRGNGWESAAENYLDELTKRIDDRKKVAGIPRIAVYKRPGLTGKTTQLIQGRSISKLKSVGLDDVISSFYAIVPDGGKVVLYKDPNFRGDSLTLGPGKHVFGDLEANGWEDRFSSIKFFKSNRRTRARTIPSRNLRLRFRSRGRGGLNRFRRVR